MTLKKISNIILSKKHIPHTNPYTSMSAVTAQQIFKSIMQTQIKIRKNNLDNISQLSRKERSDLNNITSIKQILKAINKNSGVICILSEKFKNDPVVILHAMKYDFSNIQYAGQELKEEIGNNEPVAYLKKKILYNKLQNNIPINSNFNPIKKIKI